MVSHLTSQQMIRDNTLAVSLEQQNKLEQKVQYISGWLCIQLTKHTTRCRYTRQQPNNTPAIGQIADRDALTVSLAHKVPVLNTYLASSFGSEKRNKNRTPWQYVQSRPKEHAYTPAENLERAARPSDRSQ
jgi:hypothetical protein